MENINNTITPESPIQSFELPIISQPPKPNIFKYLFIASIFILLVVVVSFIFVLKKLNSKTNNISQIITTTIPTEVSEKVTPTATNSKISAYSKLQNGTMVFILNKDDKETIIDSFSKEYFLNVDNNFLHFKNIKFSNSFRYLAYEQTYETGGVLKIYDTQDNIPLISLSSGVNFAITNDDKHLIYCQTGGEGAVEGQIISLPDTGVKFDFVKYLGNKITDSEVNCLEKNNQVTFYYNGDQKVTYDLTTSEVN